MGLLASTVLKINNNNNKRPKKHRSWTNDISFCSYLPWKLSCLEFNIVMQMSVLHVLSYMYQDDPVEYNLRIVGCGAMMIVWKYVKMLMLVLFVKLCLALKLARTNG